nr:DNA-(apurinic or apyrimidinic site) lyase [Ipomoea batatas]
MSSSSIGSTQWLREVRCWCGEVAPVKMSWSDANPGKRYRACPHYGGNGNCWYFEWIDSDVTERVSRVIRGLLKKLDKKDNEIERLQTAIEKQNEKGLGFELLVMAESSLTPEIPQGKKKEGLETTIVVFLNRYKYKVLTISSRTKDGTCVSTAISSNCPSTCTSSATTSSIPASPSSISATYNNQLQ